MNSYDAVRFPSRGRDTPGRAGTCADRADRAFDGVFRPGANGAAAVSVEAKVRAVASNNRRSVNGPHHGRYGSRHDTQCRVQLCQAAGSLRCVWPFSSIVSTKTAPSSSAARTGTAAGAGRRWAALPERVRAVRQHDDHAPLEAGHLETTCRCRRPTASTTTSRDGRGRRRNSTSSKTPGPVQDDGAGASGGGAERRARALRHVVERADAPRRGAFRVLRAGRRGGDGARLRDLPRRGVPRGRRAAAARGQPQTVRRGGHVVRSRHAGAGGRPGSTRCTPRCAPSSSAGRFPARPAAEPGTASRG